MTTSRVYHDGELEVQRRAGESEQGRRNGVVIRDEIVGGARPFLERLPYVVAGTRDAAGQPWTHLLLGETGFVRTDGGHTVCFDLARTHVDDKDPMWSHRETDSRMGLLFLELESRRRLRVNGTTRLEANQLIVDVAEAYPNCPKYIQRRALIGGVALASREAAATRTGTELPSDLQSLVAAADTFFIASAHPERGVDASHRGGTPGFVRVLDAQTLEVPDYPGNSMYNTLGNLTVDSRAGLLFIDFAADRTLQLIGRADIRWDQDAAHERTGGTGRLWRLHLTGWREATLPAKLRWEFLDASPLNPA